MRERGSSMRVERIAELLKRELADIFLRRVKDPRLQECVVSNVRVSSDLRVAWVGLSIYDADEPSIRKALAKASGYIRREAASRLDLRHSPELRFEVDRGPKLLMDMTERLRSLNIPPDGSDPEDEDSAE
ncbi:30S ribosome-binding factor RbfA [Candidatus Poribacteria bacterium]|nr:30S ribosome-binding factor RbfA [Candidatus Poribacteria bacterium]